MIKAFIIFFKELFAKRYYDDKCERCGVRDEEINICASCGRRICDACIADFVCGECVDCYEK